MLTLDPGGDFLSTTLQVGQGHRLRRLDQIRNPHSLGELYSAFTWLLGFEPGADEGKVMGLSSYGRDVYVKDLRDLVRLLDGGRFKLDLAWFAYQGQRGWFSRRGRERFGPRRVPESEITAYHEDLAYAVRTSSRKPASPSPGRCGRRPGCVTCASWRRGNSVMNARILAESGFDEVFIQPAASDAGNAVGAAAWVWHQMLGQSCAWQMSHAFWGPSWTDADTAATLAA